MFVTFKCFPRKLIWPATVSLSSLTLSPLTVPQYVLCALFCLTGITVNLAFSLIRSTSVLRFSVADTPIEEFTPTPAFPALQYLESVDEGGVAWQAGLRTGDFLIEVSAAPFPNLFLLYLLTVELYAITLQSPVKHGQANDEPWDFCFYNNFQKTAAKRLVLVKTGQTCWLWFLVSVTVIGFFVCTPGCLHVGNLGR